MHIVNHWKLCFLVINQTATVLSMVLKRKICLDKKSAVSFYTKHTFVQTHEKLSSNATH